MKMEPILKWIEKALRSPEGDPSTKRAVYAVVIAWSMGIVSGVILHSMIKSSPIPPEVIDLVKTIIYASTGGYAIGRFAEGQKGQS